MKPNRQHSFLKSVGVWLLLLAILPTLAGCNVGNSMGEGTGTEGDTTVKIPTANDLPRPPYLVETEEPVADETTSEDGDSGSQKPEPIAPSAMVTDRCVGQGGAGSSSGTFYNGDHWFYAVVLEVREGAILVRPYESTAEYQTADRILVSTASTTSPAYSVPAFSRESLIMVVYDGVITPGEPARILSPVRFEVYVHGFGWNGVEYFCAGAYGSGYFSHAEIYNSRLNRSGGSSIPIYHITCVEELKEVLDLFSIRGIFDSNVQSRNQMEDFLLSTYGEEYFAKNDLVLSYLVEGSGSYRNSVEGVTVADGMFSLAVEEWQPIMHTCDMAGWFATVEVAKEAMEEVSVFGVTVREVIWNGEE